MQNIEVRSGFLSKQSTGATMRWQKRWFQLTNKHELHYWKTNKQTGKCTTIELSDATILAVSNIKQKPFCIRIETKNKGYVLAASSENELKEWMILLDDAKKLRKNQTIESKLRSFGCEIAPEQIEWSSETVGKGGFGVVKKGIWIKSTVVAIKTINNIPEFTSADELGSFYKEMQILSELRHPCIVSMIGFCMKDNYICLVTEFVKGGDLYSWIHDLQQPLTVQQKIGIASNICAGIIYLHTKGIIHRDLKPHNVLIESREEGKVKVCDFGLSKVIRPQDTHMTANLGGSPVYAAPELNSTTHTNKRVSDNDSMARLWELDTRDKPWKDATSAWQIAECVSKGMRPPLPSNCTFGSIIMKAWKNDPNSRPTFTEIFADIQQLTSVIPVELGGSPYHTKLQESGSFALRTSFTQQVSNSNSSSPRSDKVIQSPTTRNNEESRILQLFVQDILPWVQFATALYDILRTPKLAIASLQFLFTEQTVVYRSRIETLLQWYSPLVEEKDAYANMVMNPAERKYTMSYISSLLSPKWFHGFISAEEASKCLQSQPDGSFLFRFSGTPHCYTLSANHLSEVRHWRITTEPDLFLNLDGQKYLNFHQIISAYSSEKSLIVFQLLGTGKENVRLTKPIERKINEYSNVF